MRSGARVREAKPKSVRVGEKPNKKSVAPPLTIDEAFEELRKAKEYLDATELKYEEEKEAFPDYGEAYDEALQLIESFIGRCENETPTSDEFDEQYVNHVAAKRTFELVLTDFEDAWDAFTQASKDFEKAQNQYFEAEQACSKTELYRFWRKHEDLHVFTLPLDCTKIPHMRLFFDDLMEDAQMSVQHAKELRERLDKARRLQSFCKDAKDGEARQQKGRGTHKRQPDQKKVDQWFRELDAALADYSKMTVFPPPPAWPCTNEGCKRTKKDRALEACPCCIKFAFKDKDLKTERLRFHPDKYSRCPEDVKEKFQKMAREIFVVVDALYKSK